MRNRITPPSRWPLDLQERIDRGMSDIAFAAAMSHIMGECEELDRIALLAFGKVQEAMRENQSLG